MQAGEHVTLCEVLSHTAGTTVHGFLGYAAGARVPSVDDVLVGRPAANTAAVVVDTPPGTTWRYSGGGYTVVQKLIGDVTGRPFADVLHDEVLSPAGMTRSTFAQQLDTASPTTAAWPHDTAGRAVPGGRTPIPSAPPRGCGARQATLLRFAVAVRDSAAGAPGALLDRTLATQMLTSRKGDYALASRRNSPTATISRTTAATRKMRISWLPRRLGRRRGGDDQRRVGQRFRA